MPRNQAPLGSRAGYRPDFRFGDTVVEVKSDLHSFRNLRAALMQLAYYITEDRNQRGALILVNPRISEEALRREWRMVERTMNPAVLKRLSLSVMRNSEISAIAGEPITSHQLLKQVNDEARARPYRAPQSSDAILLLLLNEWFMRKGPTTTKWLIDAVGSSYPTVANALRRLRAVIKRYPDRRIQLWGFPTDEWQRVVANRAHSHPTVHYADASGQPRKPESLLRHASELGRDDLAVGGVLAARHYYPSLDLRGVPRLDLTLHSPDGRADLSFVEELDPALERVSVDEARATLAVHVLRRQGAFFEATNDGLPWADRVSTLLDLYDARLESQANEFLEYLVANVG